MKSSRLRRELARELPRWKERNWLTPEGEAALVREYELDRKPFPLATLLSALFATALLLGGLILVLAHNWNELPRGFRLFLALVPTASVIGLGVWRLRLTPRPGPAWAESLALASSLCVALSISLVAQVYHISGDLPSFLLTWALLTLPAALLLEASVAWILYQVLALVWLFNVKTPWALPGYLGLQLAAILPACLPSVWVKAGFKERPVCLAVLLFTSSIALGRLLMFHHTGSWPLIGLAAWFALLATLFVGAEHRGHRVFRSLACIALAGTLLPLGYEDVWRHLSFETASSGYFQAPSWQAPMLALLGVAGLGGVLFVRHRLLDSTAWLWGLCGLAGLAATLLREAGLDPFYGMMLGNLLVFGLAVETLRRGLLGSDSLRTNLGWLLLCVLILLRFFDSHVSYLLRGLVFIGLGLGFLIVNTWLRRRRQANG